MPLQHPNLLSEIPKSLSWDQTWALLQRSGIPKKDRSGWNPLAETAIQMAGSRWNSWSMQRRRQSLYWPVGSTWRADRCCARVANLRQRCDSPHRSPGQCIQRRSLRPTGCLGRTHPRSDGWWRSWVDSSGKRGDPNKLSLRSGVKSRRTWCMSPARIRPVGVREPGCSWPPWRVSWGTSYQPAPRLMAGGVLAVALASRWPDIAWSCQGRYS